MFGILLRKKRILEDNIKRLQNKYLDQLKVYNLSNAGDPKEIEKIKLELARKEEVVAAILNEYKESMKQLEDLSEMITSAYSSAMDINAYLDQLCKSLGIEYSDEIKMESAEIAKQIAEREENETEEQEFQDDESDKENSYIAAQEEADRGLEYESPFLSPNLQVRRTFNEADAFTPAIKSAHKSRLE